jgi:predicted transposase YbfD/YdcC
MKVEQFLDYFDDLKDHRIERKKLHPIKEILIVTLFGVISGCESFEDLEDYGQQKIEFLRKFAGFENGIPSDDTLRRFYRAVDTSEFEKRFMKWVKGLQNDLGNIIALDGKTVRGSHDDKREKMPLHMVSAFATEARIVLGQKKSKKGGGELASIKELLEWLDLTRAVITIDALGCQEDITEMITQKNGDYVLAIKGNKGGFFEDVMDYFGQKEVLKVCTTIDKGHGRIETRTCYVNNAIDWLKAQYPGWKQLRSLVMIESERDMRDGKATHETRFYISSLDAEPEKLLQIIRSHWAIENSLHWVLDMSFGEDQSRIRKNNAPANMAIIRHVALNMLRTAQRERTSIKRMRKLAAWNNNILCDIVQQKF